VAQEDEALEIERRRLHPRRRDNCFLAGDARRHMRLAQGKRDLLLGKVNLDFFIVSGSLFPIVKIARELA